MTSGKFDNSYSPFFRQHQSKAGEGWVVMVRGLFVKAIGHPWLGILSTGLRNEGSGELGIRGN